MGELGGRAYRAPHEGHAIVAAPSVGLASGRRDRWSRCAIERVGGLCEHRRLRGLPNLGRSCHRRDLRALEPVTPRLAAPLHLPPHPGRSASATTGSPRHLRETDSGSVARPGTSSTAQPMVRHIAGVSSCEVFERAMESRGGTEDRQPFPTLGIRNGPCGRSLTGRPVLGEAPKVPGTGMRPLSVEPQEGSALVLPHRLRQPCPRRATLPEASARGPQAPFDPSPSAFRTVNPKRTSGAVRASGHRAGPGAIGGSRRRETNRWDSGFRESWVGRRPRGSPGSREMAIDGNADAPWAHWPLLVPGTGHRDPLS